MANKVKPFYIRITDDMTPQMVQDAFDKCVDAGAVANDGVKITNRKHQYEKLYGVSFDFFGVDSGNNTYIAVVACAYGELAQEITLDQLNEWLGLVVEQEWKGGDRCVYKGSGAVVIGWHPNCPVIIIDSDDFGLDSCSPCELSKPETPEQKAERERLEEQEKARKEALSMLDEIADMKSANVNIDCTYAIAVTVKSMIELGYRKQ